MTEALVLLLSVAAASEASNVDLAKPPVFFAISVPNLEASVKWYTDTLGLTVTRIPPTPQAKVAVVRGNGLLVELIQPTEGFSTDGNRPSPRERYLKLGLVKVGFHVDDLDATLARLQQRGARVMGSIYSDQRIGVRSVLVLDNDENLIQLFQLVSKP